MTGERRSMPTRRQVLGTAGAAVCGTVCGAALTACGDAGSAAPVVPPGIKGQVIARQADVPVGGGKVIDKWKILITQPTAGVFKAFTARCPHRGCTVGRFHEDEGTVECPCHGSTFSIATGERVSGPENGPLAEFPLRVEGDGIVIL